jgi:DNA-binding IclR family transcriptional regulator
MKNDTRKSIKSVERAFTIIEALNELNGATVTELTEHLNLNKSTVYYHVDTLSSLGYLIENEGTYDVGIRFLTHGGYARHKLKVYQTGKEEAKELAKKTDEVVSIGCEDNGQRLVLYRAEGSNAVYDNSPVGDREYMHMTATGKAILAYSSKEHIEKIFNMYGLPQSTEHTITDENEFYNTLEKIRSDGHAVSDEENIFGMYAISVPIICDEIVRGGIAIAGPKNRLSDEEIPELVNEMKSAANAIELKYKHY